MKKETNGISELTKEELKNIFGGEWVIVNKVENGVEIAYLIYR